MTPAIAARGLSKRYRLGGRASYGALRDSIARATGAPVRAFRRLARGAPPAPADAGWVQALDDVSFEVAQGEVVGIIGRNGSGKSTLLKILSRITDPSAGQAWIRGQVGSLLEVGTGFHPELTGRENIFVNGAILGMRRAEILRKFDEIVAFADVSRFLDTPVKHYSSGMQMRLAFSVAAHLEPHILLIDEVLAVGDLAFQRKCLGKMDDVGRDGRTVLFVSHQMNQLRRLCRRCLWLEQGRLVDDGPTADVTGRYEASFMTPRSVRPGGPASGAQFLTWTLGEGGSAEHALEDFGPVTVRFTLRIDRPIRNGHHGIHLHDRDGRVLWGTGTDNLSLPAGLYEIVYELEGLPVRPGPYRWHVTLYDEGHFVDDLECVPEMSVRTPPLGHRRDELAGVLNFPYTMEVAEVSTAFAGAGAAADRRIAFRRQP
jgi:lipopolysaccharide transport system ATP-binding protein